MTEQYDRSKIIEERIPGALAPVIDGDTGQQIQYLRILMSTKPQNPGIINTDRANQDWVNIDHALKVGREYVRTGDRRVFGRVF